MRIGSAAFELGYSTFRPFSKTGTESRKYMRGIAGLADSGGGGLILSIGPAVSDFVHFK